MYRLFLKHKLVSIISIFAVLCALISPMLWEINSNAWIYAIFYTFFAVLAFCLVESASDKLLKKPSKALNLECDPAPLLNETGEHLRHVRSGISHQPLLLNHAVALSYTGDYEKALEILSTLDIEKYRIISPYYGFLKVIYYNNLSDVYDELGDLENASLYHEKTMLAAKKNGVLKSKEMILARASEHLRKSEPEKALEALECFKGRTPLDSVCSAMVYAKAYIALKETDQAKEKLNFIIEKGNKLYMVEQARKMLAEIEKAQKNGN